MFFYANLDTTIHEANTDVATILCVPATGALSTLLVVQYIGNQHPLPKLASIVPPLVLPSPEAEYLSSALNGIENPDVAISHWTSKVRSAKERPEGQSGK